MPHYDYKSLSPQDLEELTRDLLQAEWGVPIEAFKTGRDQGIDLRYVSIDTGKVIVQCKHYASSTVSSLLSHLKNSELPKVRKLGPDRYIIATSLPLGPNDKDKIVEIFSPFILTTADILGADDLNGLLSRYPAIERSNFKLWLTSTSVLERVMHNAELCRAEFEVERIRTKLPVFVQSNAFNRAQQLLDEQRSLIISGVPGIGKTTLAEMLLYAHLDRGYRPIVLQTDLSEGKKLFRREEKQIFYYDDFLGQTFLGDQRTYVSGNHDAAMISFMEMVRCTPHSKFILTTREHILRQAFQISERFLHSTMMTHRCVLELNDYSFGQRSRILYNHLYFSDLPQAYKDKVLEGDFFLDIIKHEHFNPRLIEWLVSLTRLQSPPPDRYKQSILDLLQSPERIWDHAFQHQISEAGRDLLLSLYSLGHWGDIADLEPAFEAFHAATSIRYNRARKAADFRTALQELDGAFLSYNRGNASFVNPSVREFTAGIIVRNPHVAEELLDAAIKFRQFSNIWEVAKEQPGQPLLATLLEDTAALRRRIERLLYGPSLKWKGNVGTLVDVREEDRLGTLFDLCDRSESAELLSLSSAYADWLIAHWKNNNIDFSAIVRTLDGIFLDDWMMQSGGQPIYRKVLNALLDRLDEANADDWLTLLRLPETSPEWLGNDHKRLEAAFEHYQAVGVREEWDSCHWTSDLEELRRGLKELSQHHGADFLSEISRLDEEIAEREERESKPEYETGNHSARPSNERTDTVTEDEVRAMFRTLRM